MMTTGFAFKERRALGLVHMPPSLALLLAPHTFLQCFSHGNLPVRSHMLKAAMIIEPAVMRNNMTDIWPSRRNVRLGESVYLKY